MRHTKESCFDHECCKFLCAEWSICAAYPIGPCTWILVLCIQLSLMFQKYSLALVPVRVPIPASYAGGPTNFMPPIHTVIHLELLQSFIVLCVELGCPSSLHQCRNRAYRHTNAGHIQNNPKLVYTQVPLYSPQVASLIVTLISSVAS